MKLEFKDVLSAAIVLMFGFSIYQNPHDPSYSETLKNVMMIAVGYYLGGSRVGNYLALKNAKTTDNSDPQPVTVVNDETAPVPTVETK